MEFSWNRTLLDQMDFHWRYILLPRLAALTDEQYLWEPVEGCWSVRPGKGDRWLMDGTGPARDEEPPPFTTIAWRIAHLTEVFGQRASNHFGDGSFDCVTYPWSGTAAGAVVLMTAEHDRWQSGVEALGEDGLFSPCGTAEGPYAAEPFLTLVLHINREFLHHAAEVMLLMDLYRNTIERNNLTLNNA